MAVTDDHELVERYTLDFPGDWRGVAAGGGVVVVVSADQLTAFKP